MQIGIIEDIYIQREKRNTIVLYFKLKKQKTLISVLVNYNATYLKIITSANRRTSEYIKYEIGQGEHSILNLKKIQLFELMCNQEYIDIINFLIKTAETEVGIGHYHKTSKKLFEQLTTDLKEFFKENNILEV